MKEKVLQLLEWHSKIENGNECLIRCKQYDEIAEDIVKLFAIPDVSVSVCGWCGNKLCDSQKFNNTCFKCGKSPYSKQTER